MFGDRGIFGTGTLKSDSKGRIFIPSFTGASDGDRVVILRTGEKEFNLEVKSVEEFEKTLARMNAAIENVTDKNKIIELRELITDYCLKVLRTCDVDKTRRCTGFDADTYYDYVGCGDSLKLRPRKEL